jgi:hypothetical protein
MLGATQNGNRMNPVNAKKASGLPFTIAQYMAE